MITEKMTDQEHDYYQAAVRIYNELNGTELEKSILDLREKIIDRLGKLKDHADVLMEQGGLRKINDILNFKNKSSREISRLEELMEKDEAAG